jgi:hypothetical protein
LQSFSPVVTEVLAMAGLESRRAAAVRRTRREENFILISG